MLKRGARIAFAAVILKLFAGSCGFAGPVTQWYEDGNQYPPNPKMQVEDDRFLDTFIDLKISEILSALKYELASNRLSGQSAETQKQLLDIINDPALKMIYTGKQSLFAHSSGAQTLDKDTILFNQEGFFQTGAALPAYTIARHIIHEIGHVHQLRYNWGPRPGSTKEWFPEELEKGLSPENFSEESISEISGYFKTPKIEQLIGTNWSFGRSREEGKIVDTHLCDITLTGEEVEGHGYVIKSCHANESFWELKGNQLIFKHEDGRVTTSFTLKHPGYYEGPYYVHPDVPLAGVTHYLRRQ